MIKLTVYIDGTAFIECMGINGDPIARSFPNYESAHNYAVQLSDQLEKGIVTIYSIE